MASGIYKILNTVSKKFYVGSAVDLKRRLYKHRYDLNRKIHHCGKLQNAWNKYGPDAFQFLVIELIEDKTQLIEHEQVMLNAYWESGMLYNILPNAGNTLGFKHSAYTKFHLHLLRSGKPISAEHKQKLCEYNRNRKLTPEQRCRKGVNLGKVRSAETRAKISAAKKGKKHCPEANVRKSERQKGNVHSEETKQKMRAAWIRRKEKKMQTQTNDEKILAIRSDMNIDDWFESLMISDLKELEKWVNDRKQQQGNGA